MHHAETMGTLELFRLLWKGKYWILCSVFLAAMVGLVIANLIPKSYETVVITRPASPSVLAELSEILAESPGEWHLPTNIYATTQQIFLRLGRDRNGFLSYVHSYQEPTSNVTSFNLKSLNVVAQANKNDDAIEFRLDYGDHTSGSQILNGFVKRVIDKTSERLHADGRSSLEAGKATKERELARLREYRDISAKKTMFIYQQAFDTAKNADIETPIVSSLGALSGQQPLFYYGTKILASELKHIDESIGNDLAIPEFPELKSRIDDSERRIKALDHWLGTPFDITETASENGPIFPPKTPILLICIAIGTTLGVSLVFIRFRNLRSRP
jgi:LPS O-antigen subunit length determinant protein (WzzB/FepE family)